MIIRGQFVTIRNSTDYYFYGDSCVPSVASDQRSSEEEGRAARGFSLSPCLRRNTLFHRRLIPYLNKCSSVTFWATTPELAFIFTQLNRRYSFSRGGAGVGLTFRSTSVTTRKSTSQLGSSLAAPSVAFLQRKPYSAAMMTVL